MEGVQGGWNERWRVCEVNVMRDGGGDEMFFRMGAEFGVVCSEGLVYMSLFCLSLNLHARCRVHVGIKYSSQAYSWFGKVCILQRNISQKELGPEHSPASRNLRFAIFGFLRRTRTVIPYEKVRFMLKTYLR